MGLFFVVVGLLTLREWRDLSARNVPERVSSYRKVGLVGEGDLEEHRSEPRQEFDGAPI